MSLLVVNSVSAEETKEDKQNFKKKLIGYLKIKECLHRPLVYLAWGSPELETCLSLLLIGNRT